MSHNGITRSTKKNTSRVELIMIVIRVASVPYSTPHLPLDFHKINSKSISSIFVKGSLPQGTACEGRGATIKTCRFNRTVTQTVTNIADKVNKF